jgi:hypothetical protein
VTGVLPFAFTAAIVALQRSERARIVALSGLTTVLGAVPVAIITRAVMKGAGYVTVPTAPPLEVAKLSSVWPHVRIMAEGLTELTNGYLRAPNGSLVSDVGAACDVVLAVSLLSLLYSGAVAIVKLIRRRHKDAAADLARGVHMCYWLSSAVAVCGAFLFTTAPGTGVPKHEAYYLTLIFSVAAIVPLSLRLRSDAGWVMPVGLTIFVIGSTVGLNRNYLKAFEPQVARYASTIVHLAKSNHATVGYAGYWDASSLTWNSQERILVRPLEQCANSAGAEICPFFLMRTPSWYAPKQRRTFLLVDPSAAFVVTLPRGLGNPIASYALGSLTMYVYPYDIASRLGPPPN